MASTEFEAAGLYDAAAPDAEDRLALLEWLAAQGATIEQMVRAHREHRLPFLAGELLLHGGEEYLDLAGAAGRLGIPPQLVERILLANGLPPTAPGMRVFTESDLEGLGSFAVGAQVFGQEATERFARVLGSALSRIAEAAVSLFNVNVEGPIRDTRGGELALAQANLRAMQALETVPVAMRGLFRSHVETAIRRFRQARTTGSVDTMQLTVGFVDLVGFTTLSRQMEPRELAEVIQRFEDTAHDVTTARDGRVVKLIGDEVMFVAVDATAACDIALTLVERFAGDPSVTPRGGLAFGELLVRGGDYYGPIVNLAARMAELAVPKEVLATAEVAAHARDDGLRFEPAGKRLPKGFAAPVALMTVERG